MSDLHDLSDLVTRAAQESPDRLAVVEADGRSLTWAQLEDEVARIASGLQESGMVAGNRLMLMLGNRLEFITTYLGTLRAHMVAVPINPRSTADEVRRMIEDSGSRMVVADHATAATARGATTADPDGPRLVLTDAPTQGSEWRHERLRAAEPRPVPRRGDPDGLAVLLYTSGTSGRPRAAMLTHRALLAGIDQVAAVRPPMIHGDDVVLGVLPLFHVYGLNAVLGGVLRHRAKLVLMDRFDAERCLDLIEDEACSVVPVAPPVFAAWLPLPGLRERLGPVRLVLSGSAPLSAEIVERFEAETGVPVHQGYGLTEAAPVVTTTLVGTDRSPGSVGAALPGIELRLIEESGAEPADGDPGEIEIRGDNLFSGYWPDGADGPDAEGWWRTGDVGFLDAAGNLTLVDRLRELIIVSGFNVYPFEVEEVLAEVDGVLAAAVIGVPDERTGEAVVGYVRIDGDAEQMLAAIEEHCVRRLARFKRPIRIELVDELPYTGTGKVQKGRLRGLERRKATRLLEDSR